MTTVNVKGLSSSNIEHLTAADIIVVCWLRSSRDQCMFDGGDLLASSSTSLAAAVLNSVHQTTCIATARHRSATNRQQPVLSIDRLTDSAVSSQHTAAGLLLLITPSRTSSNSLFIASSSAHHQSLSLLSVHHSQHVRWTSILLKWWLLQIYF